MSESDKTFFEIGIHHKALYEEIVKNAWAIAGEMVTGGQRLVDGKYVRIEHLILDEVKEKVKKQMHIDFPN